MAPPSLPSSTSDLDSNSEDWSSDLHDSSEYSDDDIDEAADGFADGESPAQHLSAARGHSSKRASLGATAIALDGDGTQQPSPSRLRGRHGRKFSVSGSGDQSSQAYAEALRLTRESGRRASISVGGGAVGAGAGAGGTLSEATRRRHRESKKRMECADLTQRLLFRAQEQDLQMDDTPLWLHACVIPPRWRVQIQSHLNQVFDQMQFCREHVVLAWHLLLPPFDRANLTEYEQRLVLFDRSVANLDAARQQCETYVTQGERESACVFLQIWYRRRLTRRGFYVKTLRVTRQSRGLIPGLFDTIAGTSRLTIHRATQQTKLEYPISADAAKHAFLS